MSEEPPNAGAAHRPTARHGLVAGLLGGLTIIVLFFILDLVEGDPLRTPTFLAATLFRVPLEAVGGGYVLAFTGLHLAVFVAAGAVFVGFARLIRVAENALLGAVFGVFVFTVLFYVSLGLAEAEILEAPGWPAVLVGNLLAGAAMGGYLHWIGPRPGPLGFLNALEGQPVLRDGTVAGLLGAGVLALWFLVVDLIFREALFTPAALGSLLFRGAAGPEEILVSAGTVLGYTVVHVAAFLVLGVVISGILTGLERNPGLFGAAVIFFAVAGVVFLAFITFLGVWILEAMAVWSVLVGNLLAAVVMGAYLARAHPVIREELRGGPMTRRI